MKWVRGTKVVCIRTGVWFHQTRPRMRCINVPQRGQVYTVFKDKTLSDGEYLILDEFPPVNGKIQAWDKLCFRPVQSTDKGMEILERVRKEASTKQPIKERA